MCVWIRFFLFSLKRCDFSLCLCLSVSLSLSQLHTLSSPLAKGDGVHKMIPGWILYRLRVHGLHLSPEQIVELRCLLPEDRRSAFEEDMRGDRLGFSAEWNGITLFDLCWEAPEPEHDVLIGAHLPCIVSQVFEMECLPCTGDTPTNSAAKEGGDTTKEESS